MCSCISRYLFGLTLAIVPDLAWSTVTVEFDQSSQTTSATVTQSPTTQRWTVTCNANYSQGPTTFWIKCDNNDEFDTILINANTTNQARVWIGSQRSSTKAGPIDLIARGSTGPVVILDLRSSGNVGDLVVNSISTATIDGSVTGSIVLPAHAAIGQSSLDNTHVLGSILGDIDISAGTLLRLTVDGDIGTAQTPSIINVRDNLYVLEAHNIFAAVNANTTSGTWVGTFHATGTFSGSLNARELGGFVAQGIQQRFWIEGDLDANVFISEQIRNYNTAAPEIEVGGKLSASCVFKTGRNLPSGTVFSMTPVDGLAGCVILNASNSTFGWSGEVKVDGITLSPTSYGAPYYTIASSALGGGAVGLVPYHFYPQDCAYPSGSSFFDSAFNHRNPGGSSSNNRTITLRFYGPVFQNDTDPAIKIEQDLGGWVDVTNRAVIAFGSATSGNPREITIHGTDGTTGKIPFLPGTYRITGVAGKLKCGGTPADPVPDSQTNFTYDFSLTSDCNKNNRDDATDLAETVTYEGDTYHPYNLNENDFIDACDRETHGTCPADIDGNGFINALDYDWFAVLFEIGHPLADIDANGFVNALDYDLFSGLFETACQ